MKHIVHVRSGRKGIAIRRYGKRCYVVIPDDRASYSQAHDSNQPMELWRISDTIRYRLREVA